MAPFAAVAAAITEITCTAGGAIGIVTALLLVAFMVHWRRGDWATLRRNEQDASHG